MHEQGVLYSIYCCSGILKLDYVFKNVSYSLIALKKLCVHIQWDTSSAKYFILCYTAISTQQTSLPQIKTLNPLDSDLLHYRSKQWRKPPDTETIPSGIVYKIKD